MPDLRSADVLRTAGTFAIIEGVLFILGGLLLVIAPFASVVALTQVTGVLLLIAGVVGVIRTAGAPHHEHGGGTGIVGSVLAAIAGVVLLLDPTPERGIPGVGARGDAARLGRDADRGGVRDARP